MVKEKYLINEAAKEVHVESHVLRYWEEELDLPIKRNEQGHRIYTQEDIDRFVRIKSLKDQGLQLKAVKTLLEQIHNDDGGEEDMRADNPFAQKQMTKITKIGDVKNASLKNAEDSRWSERFGSKKYSASEEAIKEEEDTESFHETRSGMKNMIEIKEMKAVEEERYPESSTRLQEASKEQTMRLQYLFQKLIKEAVAANNEEMEEHLVARISESVKGDICKELDYQFRLMEERDEERVTNRHEMEDKRNEEYYKRIDELLRQYSTKNGKPAKISKAKRKKLEKMEKQENDNTVKFVQAKEEALEQQKTDKKQKWEFPFLKRTAEAKIE